MDKFYQIPTEKYNPLSHDKAYLFNLYDKISNFLAFNLDPNKNHKNKIAKPVRNGTETDFYSPFPNLVPIENLENKNHVLLDYWGFITTVKNKVLALESSKDENHKDWSVILSEVFNDQNNIIFSNGKEFCIVWGWQFENRNNYKPSIQPVNEPENIFENKEVSLSDPVNENISDENIIEPKNEDEEIEEQELVENEIVVDNLEDNEEVIIEEAIEIKKSFLEFLKWFASTYWGFLLILALLVIVTFLFKSIKYNTI